MDIIRAGKRSLLTDVKADIIYLIDIPLISRLAKCRNIVFADLARERGEAIQRREHITLLLVGDLGKKQRIHIGFFISRDIISLALKRTTVWEK